MTSNLLKNKKGAIGKVFTYLFVTIFIGILLAAFFLIIAPSLVFKNISPETISSLTKSEALVTLQGYLETPVQVAINGKNENLTMSNLIKLACIDSSYVPLLETETKKIFDSVYENYALYGFYVDCTNKITVVSTAYSAKKESQLILYLPLSINQNATINFGIEKPNK
ncbi:hypothetical protein COS75_01960 [Candidatus Pacearchaeota archaeon CG06_land_8_20_14_3_00_35_12]|nr:MAG: hypothetical protein COS75_01960 [Candidatus Pacearchaeota archaeon CG06_land_8_20_14_3_00_35_12]